MSFNLKEELLKERENLEKQIKDAEVTPIDEKELNDAKVKLGLIKIKLAKIK